MLEQFRKAKEAEIAMLHALSEENRMPASFAGQRLSFLDSLQKKKPRAVIAEYKRASPSYGNINLAAAPEDVARAYAQAGAGAISVLTEEHHFKGTMDYLDNMAGSGLPLLRKDFILHPLQIEQTAASPASAVLIIVRMLSDKMLDELLLRCLDFDLEPVVEIFNEEDLVRARKFRATTIQVNNRDLDTLRVTLETSKNLVKHKKGDEFWITASGISSAGHLTDLLSRGFDAALIGSSLMEGNPGESLMALLQGEDGYDEEAR